MRVGGIKGHQGSLNACRASKHIGGVEMSPNICGHQLNAPKCRTYMPVKKIRVFEHIGLLGASGGI